MSIVEIGQDNNQFKAELMRAGRRFYLGIMDIHRILSRPSPTARRDTCRL